MFAVEAYRDEQVRVLHRVGDQQVALTLQLRSGDLAERRVLQAFQEGLLPNCLYKTTLEYVVLAIRESLAGDDGQPFSASIGQGLADPVLDGLARELQERRWPRLLAQPLASTANTRRELTFWCAYDFLLRHRPTFFRTIGTLEESYLNGIRELQDGLRNAISQLQLQQSSEMEQVRQQAEHRNSSDGHATSNVHDLVAQHVSELDVVELHWRTDIEELKVRQRASYSDLTIDFFEQEMIQLDGESMDTCKEEPLGRFSGPLCPHSLSRPLSDREVDNSEFQWLPLRDDDPDRCSKHMGNGVNDPNVYSEVRTIFGPYNVFFVLRILIGDVTDTLPPVYSLGGDASATSFRKDAEAGNKGGVADGAGPQLPPEHVGLGSYRQQHFVRGAGVLGEGMGLPLLCPHARSEDTTLAESVPDVALGKQVRFPGMGFRSASLRFWPLPRLPQPVSLSPNAYADQLRGILIPIPENIPFEVSQASMLRDFAARCNRVTDLHFPPLSEQLADVRAATEGAPLKVGDYYCTRHSNLGGTAQVAFHLLINSNEFPASDDVPPVLHRGLRRLISECHRCHIAELSLPLLMVDSGASESSLSYAVAQRRSENMLRALKGALARLAEELAPSELPELKVINLMLPATAAQSIKAGIPSVAE
eukprot:TRINITY_DN63731_c0_g1_i1.p1 TRINITY_DN63731_c0_g1~~TRINITY_DN63731_c0_g1_i1.p1  ORF type:complete len:649 (-),score=62.93 TRINITY_DN63731_c0_g1_i1:83-2029(-)